MDSGNRARFALLERQLDNEDFEAFFETIRSIFASLPYTLSAQRDEAWFHTLFYVMVSASGVNAQSELMTSRGRIDMVMEFANKVFIIEFKCNLSAQAAIKQIKKKGYAERYKHLGKEIFLLGIDCNTKEKNLKEWKVEKL